MTYPEFLDEPFYPGGLPIDASKYIYNRQTAFKLYFKQNRTVFEDFMLKNYIIYYAAAPVWQGDKIAKLLNSLSTPEAINNISVDELLSKLLDCGIDPF